MVKKIEIKHFDLEFEKNMETQEAYIELHENYFRYVSVHDSDMPKNKDDVSLGWGSEFHNFDTRIKRESFVSVEKVWKDRQNYWVIELEANGYPVTIFIYYQKEDTERLNKDFDLIFNWVFNK